jgi:hypothetical protein
MQLDVKSTPDAINEDRGEPRLPCTFGTGCLQKSGTLTDRRELTWGELAPNAPPEEAPPASQSMRRQPASKDRLNGAHGGDGGDRNIIALFAPTFTTVESLLVDRGKGGE